MNIEKIQELIDNVDIVQLSEHPQWEEVYNVLCDCHSPPYSYDGYVL